MMPRPWMLRPSAVCTETLSPWSSIDSMRVPVESVAKMFKVEMKDLRSGDVQAMSEADVAKVVSGGKGKMVAQKAVTGAAVNDVAAYVKTLKK